jgi:hypothetical protein
MTSRTLLAMVARAAVAPGLAAESQEKPSNSSCPTARVPDLGRPTKVTDEQPLFNFGEYFVGKWMFEREVPERIFGPSGTIKGSIVYKQIEGPFFEAVTTATGPSGPFIVKETIAYRKDGKTAAHGVVDSRGLSYQQTAPAGGDLGGYFNHYFEGSPVAYNGNTVRIKNALRLTSLLRYRNAVTLSIDGGCL